MGLLSANSKMPKWVTKGTLAAFEVTAFCKHLPSTIACSFLDIKLRSPNEGHRLREVAQPVSGCYLTRVGGPGWTQPLALTRAVPRPERTLCPSLWEHPPSMYTNISVKSLGIQSHQLPQSHLFPENESARPTASHTACMITAPQALWTAGEVWTMASTEWPLWGAETLPGVISSNLMRRPPSQS